MTTQQTITLPELAHGEIYAGLILNEDGTPSHHLILLAGDETTTFDNAPAVAAVMGGELPTRREQSLLFANCKQHFNRDWYWSSEAYESDSGYAWYQGFSSGYQFLHHKTSELRARAVRRLPI